MWNLVAVYLFVKWLSRTSPASFGGHAELRLFDGVSTARSPAGHRKTRLQMQPGCPAMTWLLTGCSRPWPTLITSGQRGGGAKGPANAGR